MSQQQNISQQPQNSFTSQQPYSQPYSNHDQRQLQYQQQLQLQRLAEQRAIVDPRMDMSNRAPHFSNIQGPPFSTLPPVSSMYQQRSNQPHHQQQLQHLQFRGQQRSQPYLQQPRQSIPNHNPAGYPVTVEQYMHKHQHQQAPPVDTRQINPIHDQQKRFDPKKQQFQPVFQSFKATAPQKPISSAFNMSNLTRPYEPKPIIEPASIPAPPPVKKVTSSSSMFSLDSLLSTTFKPADTRKNLNASKRRKSLHNPIKEEKLVFADPDSQEESDQDYKTRRIPQNGKRSRKSPERFNPAKNSAAGLASNRRRRNTDLDGMPSLLNSGTDFIATSNGFISSGYRNVQTVDLPTQAAIDIKEATPDVEVREARIYVFDETRAADIPSIEENVSGTDGETTRQVEDAAAELRTGEVISREWTPYQIQGFLTSLKKFGRAFGYIANATASTEEEEEEESGRDSCTEEPLSPDSERPCKTVPEVVEYYYMFKHSHYRGDGKNKQRRMIQQKKNRNVESKRRRRLEGGDKEKAEYEDAKGIVGEILNEMLDGL